MSAQIQQNRRVEITPSPSPGLESLTLPQAPAASTSNGAPSRLDIMNMQTQAGSRNGFVREQEALSADTFTRGLISRNENIPPANLSTTKATSAPDFSSLSTPSVSTASVQSSTAGLNAAPNLPPEGINKPQGVVTPSLGTMSELRPEYSHYKISGMPQAESPSQTQGQNLSPIQPQAGNAFESIPAGPTSPQETLFNALQKGQSAFSQATKTISRFLGDSAKAILNFLLLR